MVDIVHRRDVVGMFTRHIAVNLPQKHVALRASRYWPSSGIKIAPYGLACERKQSNGCKAPDAPAWPVRQARGNCCEVSFNPDVWIVFWQIKSETF